MIFSKFRIFLVIQVLLLSLTPIAFVWSIQQEYMVVTSSSLVFIWLLQIIYLIWYLQRINRDVLKFITSLQHDDISLHFDHHKNIDAHFRKLYGEFNKIIKEISEIRSIRESEFQFFQYTIKHIATGIIAFDESGNIEICNDVALQLLHLETLKNITDVNKTKTDLATIFVNLKPGATKLIKINTNNEIIQLSVKAAYFRIKSKNVRLLSLQNIKTEIDQSELEAWQKLIRVLTHEIMNSVSPIKLLSGSLIELFEENNQIKTIDKLDNQTIENSVLGLKTIRKRSDGLSNFVENYKSLTQLPKPVYTDFLLCNFFNHIETLLETELKNTGIQFVAQCTPEDITLHADEKLIEQVIINLIKNSIESLINTSNPKITITAVLNNEHIQIQIIDNGSGIQPDLLDSIFTPFFTTKEIGSGIGLSLSHQIMHLHGGSISVKSEPNIETSFTLTF